MFADELSAKYIIFHGGIDGKVEETAKQLASFNEPRALIENKPMVALPNKMGGEFCRGYNPDEIRLIKEIAKCGFCLDFGHAICSANSQGKDDITILKCTSSYPAKLENMNLRTIKDMYEKFSPQGVKIGLSDHSMSVIPPVAAVAMGAKVIEKHFTLDRALGGADSGFSLNKDEFAEMIKAVRDTESALGKVDYSVNEANRKSARSLYVVKDIKKGEKFSSENIRSIRPSNGLHPKYYEEVLGKTAKCDLNFGTPLKLDYVDN